MARDLITDEQADGYKRELKALNELAASPGWKLFAPKLAENEKARLQGCTAKGVTPEKRAEHIEGYHDAVELAGWLPKRIEFLTAKVREYHNQR